ncbi:hypothetical protein AN404_09695 [Pediococcus acidilactici]|nr:hypothetical protein AN404_09695 [Pediococcus acidilactici]
MTLTALFVGAVKGDLTFAAELFQLFDADGGLAGPGVALDHQLVLLVLSQEGGEGVLEDGLVPGVNELIAHL